MTSKTFTVLSNLTKAIENEHIDEFSSLISDENPTSARILEALNKKKEEAIQKAVENAAEEIMAIERTVAKAVELTVGRIRDYRQSINDHKNKLAKITLAKAYAAKTLNYIPLCIVVGIVPEPKGEDAKNPVFVIPQDFIDEYMASKALPIEDKVSSSKKPAGVVTKKSLKS
jgi:DNA-binding transcriptional ArsR family regulator